MSAERIRTDTDGHGRTRTGNVATWQECTLASCWTGTNAARRMMNVLSPHMPERRFGQYVAWMVGRGANTAHAILANKGDGEFAAGRGGYCLYGQDWPGRIDAGTVALWRHRIGAIRASGLAFVPWCFADDSGAYTGRPIMEHAQYFADLAEHGLFEAASYVVLGLECDEYWGAGDVMRRAQYLRAVCGGLPIGIHQTSGRTEYAEMADICLYQTKPGKSATQIGAEIRRVKARLGDRPLVAWELDRKENRKLCVAALKAGAYAVGNW